MLKAHEPHCSEALTGRVAVLPSGPQPGQCLPRPPGLSWKGSALFLQVPLHDLGQDPPCVNGVPCLCPGLAETGRSWESRGP